MKLAKLLTVMFLIAVLLTACANTRQLEDSRSSRIGILTERMEPA